ncbi:MAG: M20 family metallopeptidase [Chthoniobacteraceae bacterium]
MNRHANVVELLQALVRIPSVNPDGNPGIEHPGEAACAEFVADFLRGIGAQAEIEPVIDGRPNVVALFPGGEGKKRLYFAPHLDTVTVLGMTIDPFAAEIREGKLWGRGASDTKGPMAAILWALWELRERIPALGWEIGFVGLMGEEAGQHGARHFGAHHRADFAVIGEPTELTVVYTHKGCNWLHLTTRGHAVHASRPELGENAIDQMLDALRALRTEVFPKFAEINDPVLGHPTANIGLLQGGAKINIVPDLCQASIDIRSVPQQDRPGFIAEIVEVCKKAAPGIEARWTEQRPLYTDPSHPVVEALVRAGGTPGGAPWFSDAALLAASGIPAVAVGPGSIAQAHTKDEWIKLEDLQQGVEFYKRFLASL